MPIWRIAPPTFAVRTDALIRAREPASASAGATSPFDRATATRSKGAASSASGRRLRRDVPQPRAVEESRDVAARAAAQAFHSAFGSDPAGAVMRVLDLDQCRRGVHDVAARLAGCAEFRGGEHAARTDFGELHSRVGCRGPGFVPDRVAFATDDDVVAGPREHAQRDLVGHRSRRQPERGFLPEELRHALLQLVRRRIFAVLIVAEAAMARSRRRAVTVSSGGRSR